MSPREQGPGVEGYKQGTSIKTSIPRPNVESVSHYFDGDTNRLTLPTRSITGLFFICIYSILFEVTSVTFKSVCNFCIVCNSLKKGSFYAPKKCLQHFRV